MPFTFIMSDFYNIRNKKVYEVMDRFPNLPSRTLARILFAEAPELFNNIDHARGIIRYLRGTCGDKNRKWLQNRKYVQSV